MADVPLPPAAPAEPTPPATPAPMDGVSAPAPEPVVVPEKAKVKPTVTSLEKSVTGWKRIILVFAFLTYGAYALWCFALLSMLPTTNVSLKPLVSVGMLTCLIGGAAFFFIGWILFVRISKSNEVSVKTRQWSLIKLLMFIIPGLILSGVVPFVISREPAIWIDIVEPKLETDLVAPISVTYSVDNAKKILNDIGLKAVSYTWDTDGDGQPNDSTVVPTTTVVYDRQGQYIVTAVIKLTNGSTRRVTKRVIIPRAVFSVTPYRAVVERPLRFGIGHLLSDPKLLKEVSWDFDGDGTADEVTKSVDVVHTFYTVGPVPVAATVTLTSNAQTVYRRNVNVETPPPLPFEATLSYKPQNLVGPVPFGAYFSIDTKEPLKEIRWIFGDGKEERGATLREVGHLYEKEGIYPVSALLRSEDGKLAELTTLVRATEVLQLPDLRFDGEPKVEGEIIKGEIPLVVKLTPKTTLPLVQFFWEDSDDPPKTSTSSTINKVYRRPGNFDLTLVAQDPEGKAMRKRFTVQVSEAAAESSFRMQPESGVAPLKVIFDASDTYIPPDEQVAGFKWLFGDEERNDEPELGASRVEHVYDTAGEYKIVLRVVMMSGAETSTERTIVVRKPVISACIIASRTTVSAGKGIEFDSSCTSGAPTSFKWSVTKDSDPATPLGQSSEDKYVFVFQEPGSYSVSLTATDAVNTQSTKTLTVNVTPAE